MVDLPQHGVFLDEPRLEVGPGGCQAPLRVDLAQDPLGHEWQLVQEGVVLDHVVPGPGAEEPHGRSLVPPPCRDHEGRHALLRDEFVGAHVGRRIVEDDQVGAAPSYGGQGLEPLPHELTDALVVLRHEHAAEGDLAHGPPTARTSGTRMIMMNRSRRFSVCAKASNSTGLVT